MFGRKPFLPIDLEMDHRDPDDLMNQYEEEDDANAIQTLTEHRLQSLQLAYQAIQKAQYKQKEVYDRKHGGGKAFIVGDIVLRKDTTRKKRAGGKLDFRFTGPYVITKSMGKGIYSLKSIDNSTEEIPKVSGALLKPFKVSTTSIVDEESKSRNCDVTFEDLNERICNSETFFDSIPSLPPTISPLRDYTKGVVASTPKSSYVGYIPEFLPKDGKNNLYYMHALH
jgi:hypothetical protein